MRIHCCFSFRIREAGDKKLQEIKQKTDEDKKHVRRHYGSNIEVRQTFGLPSTTFGLLYIMFLKFHMAVSYKFLNFEYTTFYRLLKKVIEYLFTKHG